MEAVMWVNAEDLKGMRTRGYLRSANTEQTCFYDTPLYLAHAPLTFDQIEDAFPEGGTASCDECGYIKTSAQWLHDFAANIHALKGSAT
jgi:hypothetical protein